MAGFPLETVASSEMMTGSRLFPRADWESSAALNSTFDALRATVVQASPLLAFNIKAELQDGKPLYSANPAFRETLMHAITSTSWKKLLQMPPLNPRWIISPMAFWAVAL
jgi:hypothetical protein